jgi:hypothetical protein
MVVLSVSLYPLLLLGALREVIAPTYAYMGFFFTPPGSALASSATLLFAILPGWRMPISSTRPSTLVAWVLYVLVYVPAQIVPIFASDRAFISYYPFQIALFSGFLILLVFGMLPVLSIPTPRLTPWMFWPVLGVFSIAVYASVIVRYGIPTSLPSLGDVYDVRSEFNEQARQQGAFLAYGMSWQAKVVNPLFMANGIVKRNPAFLAAGVGGQLLLFALAGHKTVLFSAFLVVGILIAIRNRGALVGVLMSLGASSLVLLSLLSDMLTNGNIVTSLFVRRLILVPGLLTGYYHEFFSENPKTRSFGPFLNAVFEHPYDLSIPNVIGLQYFDKVTMSANANLWADGFASFGYFGVISFSLVLGVILWTLNSLSDKSDWRIAIVLAGVASFSLVNSSLMTSIGTHGIGFAIIILTFLPMDKPTRPLASKDLGYAARSNRG